MMRLEEPFAGLLRAHLESKGSSAMRIFEAAGKPIFACGITFFWEGVGEIWIRMIEPSLCLGHAFLIIDEGKKLLGSVYEHFKMHRLEATVRADDTRTLVFDQHMGFEIECTKKEFYADKCDAVILRYKPRIN